MKKIIIYILLLFPVFGTVVPLFWIGIPEGQFNKLFNDALLDEWRVKIQEKSGMSLFEEARFEVQKTLEVKKWSKPIELLHTMGNTFCRWFYGSCDETSIYARLMAGCEAARETALKKMESSYIKGNTELLIASYTSCQDLASNVILSYKDSNRIGIILGNKAQIIQAQEEFIQETQGKFQTNVSNTWDIFKKKLTNFVRSIQGITRNVNVRW